MSDFDMSDSESDTGMEDFGMEDFGMKKALREVAETERHFEQERKRIEDRERVLTKLSSEMRSFLKTKEPSALSDHLRAVHLDTFDIHLFKHRCELSMKRANLTPTERSKVINVIETVLAEIESDIKAVVRQLEREHRIQDAVELEQWKARGRAPAKDDDKLKRTIYKFWTLP
jgi:hypothetical protein|tara:strand:- start:3503 stop:4021 length:519 start_codon:yes stop_codon:yes gene_type:complete